MKDDITVTSVTAQDGNGNKTVTNANGVTTEDNAGNKTVVNKDGITINKVDPTGNKTVSLIGDGLNNGGNQIKNVAKGTDLIDAVNLAQLRDGIGSNATKLVDGKNTTVEGDGSANNPYKVNVSDDLVLGKKGTDGKDGSIGLNGKDGANGISIKGGEGKAGVDGTSTTRLVVEEKNGTKHDVATLDDGMKYGGDTGNVINKKLNEQVNVVGGITDEGKLTTDDNIGVVSDGTNNLKVRLAKKLTGLESVTTGNTTIDTNGITINNGPSMTTNGINANSTRIQNVANGTSDTDAVNLGQLKSQSDALIAKGFGIKAEDGNKVHKALGEDVDVIGDGKNISTKVDGTSVRVAMKDDITVTSVTAQDGNSNKTVTNANGVTTEDNTGNKTVVNKDGITINKADPTGNKTVSLTGDGLNNGGNKITNVADGVDDKDAVNKSQLDNATAAATTTVTAGNNIIVTKTTNQNGSTNYEVALKDQVTLGSDPTKQIALDGTTGMIKAGDKVTIDGKDGKIDAGKIAVDGKDGYVTGLENKTFDLANIVSGRAATEDQLKASHDSLNQKITNMGDEITKKGMDFAGNTGEFHRDLGQKVTIKGEGTEADNKYSGENIKTVADQAGNITIKMAKNIKTDSVTTDKVKVGKDGQDGVSITGPNGADGTDGKVGISGKDGKDAVSMSGKNGIGHIGLNGKDGRSADITVEKGDPNLDDKEITRIKYKDEDGTTHQVTTKDDGMKYGGTAVTLSRRSLTLKSMLRVAFPMKVN